MHEAISQESPVTSVHFEPAHYTVLENVGTFNITVRREGGNLQNRVYVDYKTEDGTANAGSDYEHIEGKFLICISCKCVSMKTFQSNSRFVTTPSPPLEFTSSVCSVCKITTKV